MRLQDMVVASRAYQIQTSDGKIHDLKGAHDSIKSVSLAPLRFVLDDASVSLISATAFDDKSMVGEAIDLLRMPSTRIWIEWSDRASVQFLNGAGHIINPTRDRSPRKVGVLIESDEAGRKGTARMMWQGEESEAELSPFIAEFDLDDPHFARGAGDRTKSRHARIRGLSGLDPFYDRIRYQMDPSWETYYRTYCKSKAHFEEVVSTGLASVAGDLPFVAAFLLILSTRSAFEERETTFTKLNAKRARKGRQALLDHVEIKLNLSGSPTGERGAGRRSSLPRLHHVSGHLVRRADKLFWRRAHLRGNPNRGVVMTKTVSVTSNSVQEAA